MKIIISNQSFDYDMGVRLLKLKYEQCPMEQIADIWNDIKPMTFKEIAKLPNLEQRRVGILCLGLERLANEIQPTLVDKQTLKKTTMFVNADGELIERKFDDTYELFKVEGKYLSEGLENWQRVNDSYFVRCKDTSTDRYYFIWVDERSVWATNANKESYYYNREESKITAIQAIAWTLTTNVPKGNIEKIIRQGDCILIKTKGKYEPLASARHLTEKEYKTLLVAES